MPVHHFVHDHHLVERGLRNYWGYNTIGFFAPHSEYAASGTDGQQVPSSRRWSATLHRAGLEVILDVVYNHTAEGNQLGPDAVVPRHRQRGVLPARRGATGALLRHDGHRQQPADAQPARAAAHHGLAALLGHRDARGRLPLRPGRHARPAVPRGRPAERVLRPRAPGPGRLPGQAHRRAVGPRRRAATRSAASRRCGPSGTAGTATPSATSGAGESRAVPEFASRITGSSDLYESSGRRPIASINFVTAHDGFTLRDLVATTTSTTRPTARTAATARPQPVVELWRRRRRPTTPR